MTTTTIAGNPIYIPSFTTSTNLGPLPPTSFPSECLSTLWDMNTFGLGMPWTYETQGCAIKTCCPYGNQYTEAWAWMTSYYSPGVCPSEYRACKPPASPSALSSAEGETIAFCCPNNYGCPQTGDFYQFCQSLLSTSTSVIVVNNIFDQSTVSTRPFTLFSGMANSWQAAYPIQVRSRSGDTIPAATAVASTTTQGNSASTASKISRTPTTSSRTTTSSNSGSSSLSTGAIIGIAFGAFFAVAALVAGILLFIYKIRKSSPAPPQPPPPPPQYLQDTSIIPPYKLELGGQAVLPHELPAQYMSHELPGQYGPVSGITRHP